MDRDPLSRKLYRELRATCMVRRAEDYGLQVHEEIRFVQCSPALPQKIIQERENQKVEAEMSYAQWTGLCKAKYIVAQVRAYCLEHPNQKILIIAYHHAVIEYFKKELGFPALYGEIQSEETRREIRHRLREANRGAALILAQDVPLPEADQNAKDKLNDGFGSINTIFFAEMRTTTAVQERLEAYLLNGDRERRLKIFHLVNYRDNFVDSDSAYREKHRKQDRQRILDGK